MYSFSLKLNVLLGLLGPYLRLLGRECDATGGYVIHSHAPNPLQKGLSLLVKP